MPKNYCIMQIWAESGKSALPICNYSQILYQFLTFTQNLKRSLCETWRWDSKNFVKPLLHKIFVQKPVGMFGEQEYHICLHVFPLYKTFIIDL